MTMLDRMRRHRNWLKWSLGLVCWRSSCSTFPIFCAAPAPTPPRATPSPRSTAAKSRSADFRRTYQAQLQAYRSAYGGNMNEQLLKQLGIDQQILQQMVDERAALAEAERLGIKVSDEEVRQRIFAIPAFQENGGFIGEAALPAAAAHAAAADGRRRSSRTTSAAVSRSTSCAASLTDWLSVERRGARAGIPPPQRESEARRRRVHRRQLPHAR